MRVRQLIRARSTKPVTCAHELSSKLDAPRRALTAMLNARLTPQIRHLIEALTQVLAAESIDAPLMIVKGDGSLMKAAVALEAFLAMPAMAATFAPIPYAAPVQMLAYHTAVIMGKDADQPRNLAKSVTVE